MWRRAAAFFNIILWTMEDDTSGLQELGRAGPGLLQIAANATQLFAVGPFQVEKRQLWRLPVASSGQPGWDLVSIYLSPSQMPRVSAFPCCECLADPSRH